MNNIHSSNEPLVFRQVAFPVSSFNYLKDFQRDIEQKTGQRLNNNQVLARIMAEHRQFNVESEEHVSTRSQART